MHRVAALVRRGIKATSRGSRLWQFGVYWSPVLLSRLHSMCLGHECLLHLGFVGVAPSCQFGGVFATSFLASTCCLAPDHTQGFQRLGMGSRGYCGLLHLSTTCGSGVKLEVLVPNWLRCLEFSSSTQPAQLCMPFEACGSTACVRTRVWFAQVLATHGTEGLGAEHTPAAGVFMFCADIITTTIPVTRKHCLLCVFGCV